MNTPKKQTLPKELSVFGQFPFHYGSLMLLIPYVCFSVYVFDFISLPLNFKTSWASILVHLLFPAYTYFVCLFVLDK